MQLKDLFLLAMTLAMISNPVINLIVLQPPRISPFLLRNKVDQPCILLLSHMLHHKSLIHLEGNLSSLQILQIKDSLEEDFKLVGICGIKSEICRWTGGTINCSQ